MNDKKNDFWSTPLTRSLIRSPEVRLPEMLLGYFIGPFGALLSSGIFTSFLNKYFTDVLALDEAFLSVLQVVIHHPDRGGQPDCGPAHRAHPVPGGQGPALGTAVRPDAVGGQRAYVHRPL